MATEGSVLKRRPEDSYSSKGDASDAIDLDLHKSDNSGKPTAHKTQSDNMSNGDTNEAGIRDYNSNDEMKENLPSGDDRLHILESEGKTPNTAAILQKYRSRLKGKAYSGDLTSEDTNMNEDYVNEESGSKSTENIESVSNSFNTGIRQFDTGEQQEEERSTDGRTSDKRKISSSLKSKRLILHPAPKFSKKMKISKFNVLKVAGGQDKLKAQAEEANIEASADGEIASFHYNRDINNLPLIGSRPKLGDEGKKKGGLHLRINQFSRKPIVKEKSNMPSYPESSLLYRLALKEKIKKGEISEDALNDLPHIGKSPTVTSRESSIDPPKVESEEDSDSVISSKIDRINAKIGLKPASNKNSHHNDTVDNNTTNNVPDIKNIISTPINKVKTLEVTNFKRMRNSRASSMIVERNDSQDDDFVKTTVSGPSDARKFGYGSQAPEKTIVREDIELVQPSLLDEDRKVIPTTKRKAEKVISYSSGDEDSDDDTFLNPKRGQKKEIKKQVITNHKQTILQDADDNSNDTEEQADEEEGGGGEEQEEAEEEEKEEEEEEEEEEGEEDDDEYPDYEKVPSAIKYEMATLLHSFKDLSTKYRLIDKIGEGTFSTVYKAQDLLNISGKSSGVAVWNSPPVKRQKSNDKSLNSKTTTTNKKTKYPIVALKRIYVTSSPQRIYNELHLLHALVGCPNVAPLIDAIRHEDQVIAVLPFYKHSDFRDFYRDLPLSGIKNYIFELLTALSFVHEKKIIHRDIKPTNFLYNPFTRKGVLVDFGLAERENDNYSSGSGRGGFSMGSSTSSCPCLQGGLSADEFAPANAIPIKGYLKDDQRPARRANRAGTRGFRAPEVLFKCPNQSVKVDIWSVGVLLLTLLSRRFPFFNSQDDIDAIIELTTIFGYSKMKVCAMLHGLGLESNLPKIEGQSLAHIIHKSLTLETEHGDTVADDSPIWEYLIFVDKKGRSRGGVVGDEYHDCLKLLNGLLELNPADRWSADRALKCQFFNCEARLEDLKKHGEMVNDDDIDSIYGTRTDNENEETEITENGVSDTTFNKSKEDYDILLD